MGYSRGPLISRLYKWRGEDGVVGNHPEDGKQTTYFSSNSQTVCLNVNVLCQVRSCCCCCFNTLSSREVLLGLECTVTTPGNQTGTPVRQGNCRCTEGWEPMLDGVLYFSFFNPGPLKVWFRTSSINITQELTINAEPGAAPLQTYWLIIHGLYLQVKF